MHKAQDTLDCQNPFFFPNPNDDTNLFISRQKFSN